MVIFAALLHALHHLELFLHKANVQTEALHHLAVKDVDGNFRKIGQLPDWSPVHTHSTIGFRTVGDVPRIRRGSTGIPGIRLRNGTHIQEVVRTVKAVFLLFTINRIVIPNGIILFYGLALRTETVLTGRFEQFLQLRILTFLGVTRVALASNFDV